MNGDARVRGTIREIVARIIADYRPEKIILFGSFAYGEPHADSDIDLLIIKATPERLFQRMATVRRLVAGAAGRTPFEPLILTPAEVEARVGAGDQFVGEILERGEVLYAA
jgi:predicted nucleotidyltransferase